MPKLSWSAPARRWSSTLILLAVLAALAALWNPSVAVRRDIQDRATWAPMPLSPHTRISQTFASLQNGLDTVEVILAHYRSSTALPPELELCMQIYLADTGATVSPVVCQPIAHLAHNSRVRLTIPELRRSRMVAYRADFWSNQPAAISLWASREEAYAHGELRAAGQAIGGDLVMAASHRYRFTDALADLARLLDGWAWPLACLGLLLTTPGLALCLWLKRPLYLALPLSLATWPLALLWLATLGAPYGPLVIWMVLALSLAATAAGLICNRHIRLKWLAALRAPTTCLLVSVTALSLAVRLLNVRELVLPNWVDSLHHTAITQLIVEAQGLPADGGRFVALPGFYYHFGFHALAAALRQVAGITSHEAVLIAGQGALALAPVGVYALAKGLGSSHRAAVIGAIVVGCWSYMPAYYASWGRYPQMAGLLLAAGAMPSIWRLASAQRPGWRLVVSTGLLVGALLLTHYRILALLVPWGLVLLLRLLVHRRWARLSPAALAVSAALLATAPWLGRLLGPFVAQFSAYYGTLVTAPAADDAWPWALMAYRWSPLLLGAAGAGLVGAVLRRRWSVAALGLWAGLSVLVPNLHWIGLPDLWLVNNTTVAIAYWLPVGVLVGWLVAEMLHWIERRSGVKARIRGLRLAGLAVALGLSLWGAWLHVDVINPGTVLATPDDLTAAAWARQHLPEDALVLVNSTHWTNTARRGSDAGWWLPLLGSCAVTLPNALYIQGGRQRFDEANQLAIAVEEAFDLCAPDLLRQLASRGVTHVYVGAAGGPLTPARLDACRAYVPLYVYGPTRFYAFSPESVASR